MKSRFLRPGDELADDDAVVVRGGPLDHELLTADGRHHVAYGTYAISVIALRGVSLDEVGTADPIRPVDRHDPRPLSDPPWLRLTATGRNPNRFSVELGDLESGVTALPACGHDTVDDLYHDP